MVPQCRAVPLSQPRSRPNSPLQEQWAPSRRSCSSTWTLMQMKRAKQQLSAHRAECEVQTVMVSCVRYTFTGNTFETGVSVHMGNRDVDDVLIPRSVQPT